MHDVDALEAQVPEVVREALADDLDTPAALRAIDEWAMSSADAATGDPDAPRQVSDVVSALLGIRI